MGTQSVIVRLLMRGIPQTNVMTGNMTQLGIETTDARCWRGGDGCVTPGTGENAREFARSSASGLPSFSPSRQVSFSGPSAAQWPLPRPDWPARLVAVVMVGALTLWAVWRERQG